MPVRSCRRAIRYAARVDRDSVVLLFQRRTVRSNAAAATRWRTTVFERLGIEAGVGAGRT
nr:hypothetical protein GCM10010200_017840 [Actinomadura rugatobispora]